MANFDYSLVMMTTKNLLAIRGVAVVTTMMTTKKAVRFTNAVVSVAVAKLNQ